jgi:hypothetical protein
MIFGSALLLVSSLVMADEGAVATHKKDSTSNEPSGVKASDFFKMLDTSLGDKFHSLVLVFGGCFTADFTKKAKTSSVGTSGKPAAVLAATDEAFERECAIGTPLGSTFTTGVTDALNDPNATVQDAFKLGERRVRRSDTGQTPTFTPLGAGAGIKPGQGADSYHAILFVGNPTRCADWNDLDKMYKQLRDRGYPAANIGSYFGRGERATAPDDHTPILSKDDFTAGNSVKQEASDPAKCPGFSDDGQTIQSATADNLKKALEKLKTIAEASPNEQYFIWCADHSTLLALANPSSHSCDGTALCSLETKVDPEFLALQHLESPPTDPMGVVLRVEGVRGNQQVLLNGQQVGVLDPLLDSQYQFFPLSPSLVLSGTNTISVTPVGFPFTVNDAAISSGEIPVQPASATLAIPTTSQTGLALLALALLLAGGLGLRRLRVSTGGRW